MARDTTSHVYGLYDHAEQLAKIGIAKRPYVRMSPNEAQRRQIEHVFMHPGQLNDVQSAETIAHYTYLTRRTVHPDPRMIGRTEWFAILRSDLEFAGRLIQKLLEVLSQTTSRGTFIENAKANAAAVNARVIYRRQHTHESRAD